MEKLEAFKVGLLLVDMILLSVNIILEIRGRKRGGS